MSLFKRVMSDISTSANGDFDPARVIGYGFVVISGLVFLGLTIYTTWKTGAFSTVDFTIGVAGLSASITAAAAGVLIKKSTEVPLEARPVSAEPVVLPVVSTT